MSLADKCDDGFQLVIRRHNHEARWFQIDHVIQRSAGFVPKRLHALNISAQPFSQGRPIQLKPAFDRRGSGVGVDQRPDRLPREPEKARQ